VAAGVTLLAEPFTATIAVSFVLILAGCLLATARQSRKQAVRVAQEVEEVEEVER